MPASPGLKAGVSSPPSLSAKKAAAGGPRSAVRRSSAAAAAAAHARWSARGDQANLPGGVPPGSRPGAVRTWARRLLRLSAILVAAAAIILIMLALFSRITKLRNPADLPPPRAKKIPVQAYLAAENMYADAQLKKTAHLQQTLVEEMLSRVAEEDTTAPVPRGGFFYYQRKAKGKSHILYCRKKGSMGAPEQVILDPNRLAFGHEYYQVGGVAVSDDHSILAYAADTTGDKSYTIFFKDLSVGRTLAGKIPNASPEMVWAKGARTLLYVELEPATLRPYIARFHEASTHAVPAIGSTVNDRDLYNEGDDRFMLRPSKSKDGQYLLLTSESQATTEVRYLETADMTRSFTLLQPRVADVKYYVEHREGKFLLRSNYNGATNYMVYSTSVYTPEQTNWKEFVAHRQDIYLEDMLVFDHFIVLVERSAGLPLLRVVNMFTGATHVVEFPDPAYSLSLPLELNPEFTTSTLRFVFSSLCTVPSVFEYDMNAQSTRHVKEQLVLGGFIAAAYICDRVFAPADDGVQIPVSVMYKRHVQRDGHNPLLLIAYGAYGKSLEASFDANTVSLLNRGFIIALAHVRGGAELGTNWAQGGRLLLKKNVINDVIACAQYLVSLQYTARELLAVHGTGAGAVAVGGAINSQPTLFKAAVVDTAFVDVVNRMLDTSMPRTAAEWAEWGNPRDSEYYDYMKGYSPYENIQPVKYPHMLVRSNTNDTAWQAAKFVARLRAVSQPGDSVALLKTDLHAKSEALPQHRSLRARAEMYAFLVEKLEIQPSVTNSH
eukprot:jgi/Chlat1/8177/Chrsp76S07624